MCGFLSIILLQTRKKSAGISLESIYKWEIFQYALWAVCSRSARGYCTHKGDQETYQWQCRQAWKVIWALQQIKSSSLMLWTKKVHENRICVFVHFFILCFWRLRHRLFFQKLLALIPQNISPWLYFPDVRHKKNVSLQIRPFPLWQAWRWSPLIQEQRGYCRICFPPYHCGRAPLPQGAAGLWQHCGILGFSAAE